MAYQGSITLVDLSDGQSGSSGINTATVYLYQRATTTPSGPNGTLRYTFSTHTLSGAYFNGWEQSIDNLSGSNPIWIIAATATASADVGYDDILMGEWSNPIEMAQNGQDGQDGQDGAPGQPGQDGAPGTNGINTATVYIYKRIDSPPSTPADVTYTFADGSFTIPTGWSGQVPTSDGNPCYVCSAVAISNEATATLEWSTPVVLVEDGINGIDGENGISPIVESISNGVKITDAEGNITYIYDGTSYYTHVRYSANADGHDYVSVPTSSTIYIGVYSGTSNVAPAYNDSGWTWSKYVGEDGNPGTPGAAGVSVTEVKEVYYITSGAAPTQNTLPNGTPITSTSTSPNIWTTVIPAYIANGRYYTSLQTSLSSGTSPVFSTIVLNQGLTDANANAASALTQATEANEATALLGGHFIYKSTTSSSGKTPASANVVEKISDSTQGDVTDKPAYWGFNTHIGANGIKLRHNEIDLSEWNTYGLTFYNPPEDGGRQGAAAMLLTGSELIFYKTGSSDGAATLNSSGLNIVEGSIMLGSEDSTTHRHPFEVNSNGSLYAIDATIAGGITATSLTVAPNATNIDSRLDNNAIEVGGRNLLSQNDMIIYPSGDTKAYHIDLTKPLQANTTYVIQLWDISNQGEVFIETEDTTVQENVTYYIRSGEAPNYTYTIIENPEGDPHQQGWYILEIGFLTTTINVYYCNDTTTPLITWENFDGTEEYLEGKFTTDSIISTPDDYHLTNDTTVNPNKSYYEYENDTYTLVTNISEGANPHDLNYYENRGSNGFIVIQKNTAATALTVGLFKLEQGNKATDWTVAPEDTEENLSNSIDTLENSNEVIQNSINVLSESNSNLDNYVRNHIKIDDSGLTILNEVSDSRLQLTSADIKLFAGQNQVATFGSTIILGDEAKQNIKLSSSKLGFYQGTQEVAYIGSEDGSDDASDIGTNRLFIQEAQLLNNLYIGHFMWRVQGDTRISLVYAPSGSN